MLSVDIALSVAQEQLEDRRREAARHSLIQAIRDADKKSGQRNNAKLLKWGAKLLATRRLVPQVSTQR